MFWVLIFSREILYFQLHYFRKWNANERIQDPRKEVYVYFNGVNIEKKVFLTVLISSKNLLSAVLGPKLWMWKLVLQENTIFTAEGWNFSSMGCAAVTCRDSRAGECPHTEPGAGTEFLVCPTRGVGEGMLVLCRLSLDLCSVRSCSHTRIHSTVYCHHWGRSDVDKWVTRSMHSQKAVSDFIKNPFLFVLLFATGGPNWSLN